MNQLIGITDSYLAERLSGDVTFPRLIAPQFGMPADEAAITAALPGATEVVGEVARLLGDQSFMAGDALSLADLMLAPHLEFVPHFAEGAAMLAPHDNLRAWIDRIFGPPEHESDCMGTAQGARCRVGGGRRLGACPCNVKAGLIWGSLSEAKQRH